MTIRKGRIEDISEIIEVGKRLHRKSLNSDVPLHMPTVVRFLEACIRKPTMALLVAEHAGKITGFLMAGAEPFWFVDPQRGPRYVTDFAFYSERRGDGERMLRIICKWAWSLPRVVEVNIASSTGHDGRACDELFIGAGFRRVGGYYNRAREVQP